MITVYCVDDRGIQHGNATVLACEHYPNLIDAVQDTITYYPEGPTIQPIYNDDNQLLATVCPMGGSEETGFHCTIVYVGGMPVMYRNVRYMRNPTTNKIERTEYLDTEGKLVILPHKRD